MRWRWYTERCLTNKGRSMDQDGALSLLEALEERCPCEDGNRGAAECRRNPIYRSWRTDLTAWLPLHLEPDMPRPPRNGRPVDFHFSQRG